MAIQERSIETFTNNREQEKQLTGTIALLGVGQIGTAIRKIAAEAGFSVLSKDLDFDEFTERKSGEKIDALHVCIPFKNDKADAFFSNIKGAIAVCEPEMVIIHSTVPLGTTDKLADQTKVPVFHSPVRGNHPDLKKDIQDNFVKFVGGKDKHELAISHLKKLGIKQVENGGNSTTTELGKMVNILGYAQWILFTKFVKDLSDLYGADFDIAYTEFTQTYNEGYDSTKPNVKQPILKPMPGPIGGHCVIPDSVLLQKNLDNLQAQIGDINSLGQVVERVSKFNKFILEQNDMYKTPKGGEK